MTTEIFNLYNKLIKQTGDKGLKSTYGIHKLHVGDKPQSNSILFVGRENRGHGSCIGEDKEEIIKDFEKDFNWLESAYKYTKSPFWRVVGKSTSQVVNQTYDFNIFKQIIWTNLFKISPVAKKANTKKTRDFQREICWKLLTEEIKYLKPKSVIFLTDSWVDSFITYWEQNNLISNLETVSQSRYYCQKFEFTFGSTKIPALVLPHPQNKRSGASERDLIEKILQLNTIMP